jgi:3',5'-cyclic AMP phosphodiesterase CpdA
MEKSDQMNTNETFTLAHLSDPHLANHHGIRATDFLNKRFFGYIKWRLKSKFEHHADVLAEMIQDVKTSRPDHIVITGDLTHMGLPSEFAKAKELLNHLGSPSRVTIIPGNHDAYVAGALDGSFTEWTDYMVSDGQNGRAQTNTAINAVFPSLRVRAPVALVGVSTARPCSTFLAVGCVGDEQLRRIEQMLNETGQKGLFRIILIHHPPLPGLVSWRKRLTDAGIFNEILQRRGAELILHGHSHHQSLSYLEIPGGRIPVIGVPSASAASGKKKRRARYHLYRLTRRADEWDLRVCVRSYTDQGKHFETEDEYHLST